MPWGHCCPRRPEPRLHHAVFPSHPSSSASMTSSQPSQPQAGNLAEVHALLLAWYDRHGRDLPWRGAKDPYSILVSEVMLQQTQVDRVIPKYAEFLERFPTFKALAEAPTADVIRAWSPLGYNRRAVRLQAVAARVADHLHGRLPDDVKTLRGLPGIGEYTASALACFVHGQDVPVVDTNVRRVLGRVFRGPLPPSPADAQAIAEWRCPVGAPRGGARPSWTWAPLSAPAGGPPALAAPWSATASPRRSSRPRPRWPRPALNTAPAKSLSPARRGSIEAAWLNTCGICRPAPQYLSTTSARPYATATAMPTAIGYSPYYGAWRQTA